MNNDPKLIRLCEVLSVEDDNAGLRIKVRLHPEDADIKYNEDLPYVFPLLPKIIHINPKVGECVMVILGTQGEFKGNRYFIGPVISQAYMMNYDPYNYSARSLMRGQQLDKPLPNPALTGENNGTLPGHDDIAIVGRQNCDIILKDSEMRLRCGFKAEPLASPVNTLHFNKEDLAYIQMKYKTIKDNKGNSFSSSINIVADRINLISHDSRTYAEVTDREELITDNSLRNIIDNLHPLPYGDVLIEFIGKLIKIFREHTHPYSMLPPSFDSPDIQTLSTDMQKMLSQSIRIN